MVHPRGNRRSNRGRRQNPRNPRPHDRRRNSAHNTSLIGTTVSVVQKKDQPTGRLTSGVVAEILTNVATHPRGIKVRLEDGTVGRIAAGPATANNATTLERPHHNGTTLGDFLPTETTTTTTTSPNDIIDYHPSVAVAFGEAEPTDDGWRCSRCTFQNSELLRECEMCESKR